MMVNTFKENIKRIDTVVFYNHFHNGDIFTSRPYVVKLMQNSTFKYSYVHRNHPILLQDLNLESSPLQLAELSPHNKITLNKNIICINTWIGNYMTGDFPECECNLFTLHKMWKEIVSKLNLWFDSKLVLDDDPSKFYPDTPPVDKTNIDSFMHSHVGKRVLISNGPAFSAQSVYSNYDMADGVVSLARKHDQVHFILTHKFDTSQSNIFFTEDIIRSKVPCDLNEISYLSTHCDLIFGKNSGPFTFAHNKQNIRDSSKKFICFGTNPKASYNYAVNSECSYLYIKDNIPFAEIMQKLDSEISS